jgi:hypothetical protein
MLSHPRGVTWLTACSIIGIRDLDMLESSGTEENTFPQAIVTHVTTRDVFISLRSFIATNIAEKLVLGRDPTYVYMGVDKGPTIREVLDGVDQPMSLLPRTGSERCTRASGLRSLS